MRWFESVVEDLKEIGMRNWRGTASSRMENSGGQLWKRLRTTKICNARRRRRSRRRRRRRSRRRRRRRGVGEGEGGVGGGEGGE